MFSFLKEKIKSAVSRLSGKIEGALEKPPEIIEEKKREEKVPEKHIAETAVEKKADSKAEAPEPEKKIARAQEKDMPDKHAVEEKRSGKKPEEKPEKGFFGALKEKITSTQISEDEFEESFSELETALLENNVAVEVIDKIKGDLSKVLVNRTVRRGSIEDVVMESLEKTLSDILSTGSLDFVEKVRSKKPFVMCFVGINGSGKTTTIAKVARLLQKHKLSCVIAASDTFRAAAIDQLEHHAKKLGVKMIKHDYGADPAAVAFDAIQHAKAKDIDVVLIDTAGRLHSNTNLVDEMKKIIRVAKPDMKIFVGESITGNDCVEQAKTFDSAIGLDCIILSKADVDEKGGTAVSIGYVTGKPIIFLGVGQEYDDLRDFDSAAVMKGLGF
ncbi:signal recognition particle-docking protein FtsY [Candidatus Woesearchaeota archaeon]|nr:signal recognition particle-docking protein FtsY [Candidatus Woesearchaeota archaeon]